LIFWIKAQVSPIAINQTQDLFKGDVTAKKISPEQKKLEEKFNSEKFRFDKLFCNLKII
jgi:hypothetical protein